MKKLFIVAAAASALSGCNSRQFVVATVPTSEGDLSSHFAVEEARGFLGTIVVESVTVDDVPCTRYIAKYIRKGMIISFR